MGQSGRRRKKGRAAKSAASASVPPAAENGMKITVDIHIGGIEFLEGSTKLDDANGLTGGDTGPQESLRYELAWAEKAKAVEWFKAGCDQDKSAEMWFNANLTKDQRKELHLFCSSSCPSLKSVSRGSEEERQIGIVHSSNTKWDIPTLSDADEKKARVLLSHLRDSGQTVSVDEVRGMIASQSLSAELGATADQLVNDQINVDALLDAVCSGRIDQVQALLSASPGVASVKQCDTGKLPLHTAAVAGNISIMAALVRAGASPEQQDGKERTALEAARAAEQCDAEGWLLRQGAQDHAAQHELTEASNITAIDSADAGAVHVSGTTEPYERPYPSNEPAAVRQSLQAPDSGPTSHDAMGPTTPDPEEAVKNDESSLAPCSEAAKRSAADDCSSEMPEIQPSGASRDIGAIKSGAGASAVPDAREKLQEAAQGAEQSSSSPGDVQPTGMNGQGVEASPQTAVPKANRVPEIEPAPPRPSRQGDADREFGMSIEEEDEESGIDVLVDWAGNTAAAISDFCGKYPALVATASAVIAVAGAVVVKIASSNRR